MNPICALANYFDERYIIIIFCSHMRRFYFHSRIPIIVSFLGWFYKTMLLFTQGTMSFPLVSITPHFSFLSFTLARPLWNPRMSS